MVYSGMFRPPIRKNIFVKSTLHFLLASEYLEKMRSFSCVTCNGRVIAKIDYEYTKRKESHMFAKR